MKCNFFLKAVPAIFLHEFSSAFYSIIDQKSLKRNEVFQLTSSKEIQFDQFESLIMFQYTVSPFAVMYTNTRENFFQFLISLLAIIGGVFTIAGIVDSVIHQGGKLVFKERINKLI